MKLRESLVKSSTLPVQPNVSSMLSIGQQTITALGQPRLVSFPSQGAAAIVPVGMLAVPIAHVQVGPFLLFIICRIGLFLLFIIGRVDLFKKNYYC